LFLKLNLNYSVAGSWNPKTNDKNQYIQVELPRKEPVYGVVMQGSPLFDQYVTSYELMYGDDGNAFSYVTNPDGKPTVSQTQIHTHTYHSRFIPEGVVEASQTPTFYQN
jgi:hypothetical protein